MKRILVVTMWCMVLLDLNFRAVQADELIIPVLGEAWVVTADAPPLDAFQGEKSGQGFHYQAASSQGFNISCFVEKPANDKQGHEACLEYYWPKAKRNPMIDQKSVQIFKKANFSKVTYDVTAGVTMRNANYYIAHDGRWVDIHVSMLSTLPDEEILEDFEKSLRLRSVSSLLPKAAGQPSQ